MSLLSPTSPSPKSPYSMLGSSSESSEACQEDTSKKKQIKSRHANLQYCFEKETLQLASFSPRALRASKLLILPVTGSSSRSG